jgi:hypothetical protein
MKKNKKKSTPNDAELKIKPYICIVDEGNDSDTIINEKNDEGNDLDTIIIDRMGEATIQIQPPSLFNQNQLVFTNSQSVGWVLSKYRLYN